MSTSATDLFNYRRRQSSVVHIGSIDMGGDNPIRIQSMTTTNTNDTASSVAQAERIIEAGGELVRLTTQGSREAENLKNINAGIRADGYKTASCPSSTSAGSTTQPYASASTTVR